MSTIEITLPLGFEGAYARMSVGGALNIGLQCARELLAQDDTIMKRYDRRTIVLGLALLDRLDEGREWSQEKQLADIYKDTP